MDTLTKSCSPTIVITANGEVQYALKRQWCMSKNWIFSWLWKSSTTHQQYYRSESFAMKTGIPTNGSMVKNHISWKTGFEYNCNTENFVPIVVPGLSSSSSGSSSTSRTLLDRRVISPSSSSSSSSPTVSEIQTRKREGRIDSDITSVPASNLVDDGSGQPDETQANKNPKPNKKETTIERGNSLNSEIPEWLQEFRENLVDDEIPVHQRLSRPVLLMKYLYSPIFKRREDLCQTQCSFSFP